MNRTAKKPHGKKPESKKNLKTASDSAILIIFLVLLVFIIFFFGSPGTQGNSVKEEQKKLLDMLIIPYEQDGHAIVVGDIVYSERVSELASIDYQELKGLAGITSEFVIYFEDEQGNVINIADKPCIGSSYAQVNGINCNN